MMAATGSTLHDAEGVLPSGTDLVQLCSPLDRACRATEAEGAAVSPSQHTPTGSAFVPPLRQLLQEVMLQALLRRGATVCREEERASGLLLIAKGEAEASCQVLEPKRGELIVMMLGRRGAGSLFGASAAIASLEMAQAAAAAAAAAEAKAEAEAEAGMDASASGGPETTTSLSSTATASAVEDMAALSRFAWGETVTASSPLLVVSFSDLAAQLTAACATATAAAVKAAMAASSSPSPASGSEEAAVLSTIAMYRRVLIAELRSVPAPALSSKSLAFSASLSMPVGSLASLPRPFMSDRDAVLLEAAEVWEGKRPGEGLRAKLLRECLSLPRMKSRASPLLQHSQQRRQQRGPRAVRLPPDFIAAADCLGNSLSQSTLRDSSSLSRLGASDYGEGGGAIDESDMGLYFDAEEEAALEAAGYPEEKRAPLPRSTLRRQKWSREQATLQREEALVVKLTRREERRRRERELVEQQRIEQLEAERRHVEEEVLLHRSRAQEKQAPSLPLPHSSSSHSSSEAPARAPRLSSLAIVRDIPVFAGLSIAPPRRGKSPKAGSRPNSPTSRTSAQWSLPQGAAGGPLPASLEEQATTIAPLSLLPSTPSPLSVTLWAQRAGSGTDVFEAQSAPSSVGPSSMPHAAQSAARYRAREDVLRLHAALCLQERDQPRVDTSVVAMQRRAAAFSQLASLSSASSK